LLEYFHRHRFLGSPQQQKLDEAPSERRRHRGNYYIGRNYGTIDIDWKSATVQVNVHDVSSGATVLTTGPRSFGRGGTNTTTATQRERQQQQQQDPWDAAQVLQCMDGHLLPVVRIAAVTILALLLGYRMLLRRQAMALRSEDCSTNNKRTSRKHLIATK
jgi:hypothetical protein